MKQWLKLFAPRVRCNCYLLTKGMWRGECHLETCQSGKVTLIAACKGSFFTNNLEVTRVFYKA